jgi:hypothetical protein
VIDGDAAEINSQGDVTPHRVPRLHPHGREHPKGHLHLGRNQRRARQRPLGTRRGSARADATAWKAWSSASASRIVIVTSVGFTLQEDRARLQWGDA